MNEAQIQNLLYYWAQNKKHGLITPNVKLYRSASYRSESDLISVTMAGLVYEYEIKASRADFQKEFRVKKSKHIRLALPTTFHSMTPNYYFFAVPARIENQILDLVPKYAGLLAVSTDGVTVRKKAPQLHRLRASQRDINYLSRGLMVRYWAGRLKRMKGRVHA